MRLNAKKKTNRPNSYKAYLKDLSLPIPKSTFYYQKTKKGVNEKRNTSKITLDEAHPLTISADQPIVPDSSDTCEMVR